VLAAVEVLSQSPAPQLSPAHLTVSTSGVLPGIERFLAESRAHLALSLNGTTDEQRSSLMPQNKVWPIDALLGALRRDREVQPDRTHFIEYVLFDGVNDSDDDAFRLLRLMEGINARVNLIPFNASPGDELRPPPDERVHRFQSIVHHGGLRCLVRWPRGREVRGACGQLAMAIRDAAVSLPPMPRPRKQASS
ncbi:MAG: 23S rRNA (adenine(2503)-C(2))-methyltransferase RlmN, partial [Myxococcales bacterium]